MPQPNDDSQFIIKAIRKINRHTGHHYLVFKCPVCGGKHSHGIPARSVFGENNGHRGSHCREQPPKKRRCPPNVYLKDYVLVETRSKEEAGFY